MISLRPVNVVKELIENSLDAGATKISVTVSNTAGWNVQIRDNGWGIRKEDLPSKTSSTSFTLSIICKDKISLNAKLCEKSLVSRFPFE